MKQTYTTVTQKGQVTIPKKLRDKFKIRPGDKVITEAGNGYVKIVPTEDILDIAGTFSLKRYVK